MKVAISTDGDYVSAHFGRCPSFTIVGIEQEKIISREIINNPGHQPAFLPQFLHQRGVNYIIAGGMGRRATQLFHDYGIEPILGISGSVDQVIDELIKGTLKGAENLCKPGLGKGYGIPKTE